jgi:sulfatase modifying factor 1
LRLIRTVLVSLSIALIAAACGGERKGRQHMVPGLWQSDIEDLVSVLAENHPDIYRKVSRDRLDEEVSSLVDSLGVWNDDTIILELSRLLAMIGDGHTGIEREWLEGRFRRLPVELGYFGGELRVTAASPACEAALGKVLASIGGRPVEEAERAVHPLIPRDNYAEWLVSVPRWISYAEALAILGFSDDAFSVEAGFTGDGTDKLEMTLATIPPDSFDTSGWLHAGIDTAAGLHTDGEPQAVVIDVMEGNRPAAVIRYHGPDEGEKDTGPLVRESISEVEGTGAERLIADLRGCTSRSGSLAPSFVDGAAEWIDGARGRDIVVLVDRNTCCAALETAAGLGELGGVTVVGELPRGAPNLTHSSETFRLPNSGMRITYSTSFRKSVPRLADSPWLPLDIHIQSTWKDHTSGYDAPLDTALALPLPSGMDEQGEGHRRLGGMALVPAAEFTMGGPPDGHYDPAHRVFVDSFYIDIYEVTNSRYAEFCEQTGGNWPEFWGMDEYRCGPDYPDHPVVGVSLHQARLFAEWAGKRIPTEAEWELAARGGLIGSRFPNGDDLPPTVADYRVGSEFMGTVPVGCYPPNGYGLHDMAGNVVEWVNDYFHPDYYRSSPYKNPKGPEEGYIAVIRGGGWHSGKMCCNVYTRNALKYSWVDIAVGFRCAADVGEKLR